ncbi:MAG: cytochrome c [Acidobacteria bacterium]|nr:cytochrome c [Acidobacteriota bacterium]
MSKKLFRLSLAISGLVVVILMASAAQKPTPKAVTFAKDVAPILYKNCAECHRPGEMGPMSLLSYQEARPWARSIREQVVSRQMPPWSANPQHGAWANDPRLSQQEIDTIVAWVAAGSPKGDDKDLPPVPKFTEGWTIGEPDAVFEMSEEYAVPAEGTVPYLYFSLPTNLPEDKWISAVEIRPGNRSVVHHVIAYTQDATSKDTAPGTEGETRTGRVQLTGITPNKPGAIFEEGTAKLLKKGATIVFQMHYTTNGKEAKDRTKIGLRFTKNPPKRTLETGNAINTAFSIPAGADNHEVAATRTFKEDVYINSFSPHMHVRGKSFRYTATYPDGRAEILLDVPQYDFNWQHTYVPKKPIFLPKGTRLDCVAYYDNSTKNKFNPDPTKAVRWGDQTWEEMMIGWYTYYKATPNNAPKAPAASESASGR